MVSLIQHDDVNVRKNALLTIVQLIQNEQNMGIILSNKVMNTIINNCLVEDNIEIIGASISLLEIIGQHNYSADVVGETSLISRLEPVIVINSPELQIGVLKYTTRSSSTS